MEILHALVEALLNSILITGLVIVMMMMIESFNIESHGTLFSGLKHSRFGQVIFAALLGVVPGCMGGFAVVSLYTHRMISFGALIAMLIASSGDEAFVMLAMFPDKALWILLLIFTIGIAVGLLVDLFDGKGTNHSHCSDGFEIHSCEAQCHHGEGHDKHAHLKGSRHFGWKRAVMFLGVAVFLGALAFGLLEHGHEGGEVEASYTLGRINLLSEDWMNVFFAILGIIVLAVLVFGSDHFVEIHFWDHIIKKHLARIFLWTFGVLAIIGITMHFVDLGDWISAHKGVTALMIVLAALIGIIPESGPHIIFVSIFALYLSSPELNWLNFLPVILASSISQDGHSAIPLLAESKIDFLKAKAINCAVALAVGFATWGITAML